MLPRFAASVCSTNAVTISRSWWHFCRIVHANGTNVRSATSFVINMLEKKHKKTSTSISCAVFFVFARSRLPIASNSPLL